ncbi:MAG: PAS domain S-box protein [Nodosilinea sp.]
MREPSDSVLPSNLEWEHLVATIALRIRQSLDLEDILPVAVEAVQQLLHCDRVLIYQFDPAFDSGGGGRVAAEAFSDPQWSLLNQGVDDRCFEPYWSKPYRESSVHAIADVATADIHPSDADVLASFAVKASLIVPVMGESRLWGLLIAHSCAAPRPWPSEEIDGLQQIALHIGMAVHQAELVAQLRADKAELADQVAARTQALEQANRQLTAQEGEGQQMRSALRQGSDERFQLAAIIESSEVAMTSKTPDGIITSWNQAAERLFGYTASEMIGQNVAKIIPPELQAEAAAMVKRIYRGERVETYETQRLHKDGGLVDVALTLSPIRDQTGRVVGTSKIARDIRQQQAARRDRERLEAERNQAESALKESEARWQFALEGAGDGVWDWDIQTNQLFVTHQWKAMLGHADDEIGSSLDIWDSRVHPEDKAQCYADIERHFSGETDICRSEYRMRCKDGSYKWILDRGKVIERAADGKPLRMIGIHTDISDRKQAEAELRQSQRTSHALLVAIPDLILRVKRDGTCCNFLPPSDPQTGLFLPIYHHLSEILSPDLLQKQLQGIEQALATGDVQIWEQEILKQGQTYYEEIRVSACGDDECLLMVRDITERKQTESALYKSEATTRALITAVPDFLVRMRQDGLQVQVVNQGAVHVLDIDDTGEGRWITDLLPEAIAQERVHLAQQALRTGQSQQQEYKFTADGQTYYEEARIAPLSEDEVLVVVRDISDRKRGEAERKQSELGLTSAKDQLELVLEASSEGFWDWDLITGEIYFSPQWKAMLGYADHELENSPEMWKSVIFEDDLTKTLQLIDDYKSGQAQDFTATQRFNHKNGSVVHILSRAIHLKDEQGNVVRMVGSHVDITQTVNIQTALKTSEMQLSGILNSSLDGIMAFRSVRDDQGTIVDFEWLLSNPTSCEIIGRQAGDIIGKRMLDELPGNRDDGLFDLYVQVVESGEPIQRQFYYNHDGIDCWFENIAVKLGDGFAVTFRDITAVKQSEITLQQTNQQLNDRIGELDQRHGEMMVLSEISDFLQACSTVEEACNTIVNLIEPLFPHCSGGIFITRASRNRLEQVAAWGSQRHSSPDFEPHSCWGLRRGRMHWVGKDRISLRCSHLSDHGATAATLCIPMIAQGETLGLFYLSTEDPETILEAKQQLARTLAEQVGMAIANLRLHETLKNQSIRDPLTGLYNRRFLEESLTQEIVRAQRKEHPIGVIMIDIDHFKRFNDTFGHDTGDSVLKLVGALLQTKVRSSDIACRYGGEEMILILPEASLAEAAARAEEIRVAIGQLRVPQASQEGLSASLGVACFPQHGSTGSTLIKAADTALYRAKGAGRNQVLVAL